MKISVIIPTLNAESSIGALIDGLYSQSLPPEEIIVIDSSSRDSTVSIATRRGCVTVVIPGEEFNHGSTRNIAAKRAFGELLIFMTQDALPANKELIKNLTAPLVDSTVAASFARQIPYDDASPIEKFARSFNYPPKTIIKELGFLNDLGIKTFSFSNVCSAIKREILLCEGGFPHIIMNEDMIFSSKLILKGFKVAYRSEAVVFHSHSYSLSEQFKRHFDIGVSLRDNGILDYSPPAGEGMRYIVEGVRHLIKEKRPLWGIYFFIDSFYRYAGYFLGVRYMSVPVRLRRFLSMHPRYFS